jgi:hypothetical protein
VAGRDEAGGLDGQDIVFGVTVGPGLQECRQAPGMKPEVDPLVECGQPLRHGHVDEDGLKDVPVQRRLIAQRHGSQFGMVDRDRPGTRLGEDRGRSAR